MAGVDDAGVRWRVGDSSSRLLLDVAAARTPTLDRPLSEQELVLASRHGLLGLMALSDRDHLSGPAHAPFARAIARQQVMETFLGGLLERFSDVGIMATVVKGPAVARWAYREPRHRTYSDLDLLVPESSLERVLEELSAHPGVGAIPPKSPSGDKRNVPVTDPSGVRFNLDLHWDLFSYTQLRGRAEGASDEAWGDACHRPDDPLGPSWRLPSHALMAFLCAHALLDHRFRLILFRDLAEVAPRDLDWSALVSFARRHRLRSTTYLSLLTAARVVDADVPGWVLDELRPDSFPVTVAERLLARTDLVRFDGHRPHPLNLAVVLAHDERRVRGRLLGAAPLAFVDWRKRVEHLPSRGERRSAGGPSLLLLVSSTRRRGAEVFGERLAEGLRRCGWDVDLVALTAATGEGPVIPAHTLMQPGDGKPLSWDGVVSLRRHILRTRPDVLLANGGATLRYAVAARWLLRRRPRLVSISIGEPAYWLRSRLHTWLHRFLHRQNDLVVAVSEATRRQLLGLLRLSDRDVVVAHTGVPRDFLQMGRSDASDGLRILFLGNLSREKGPLEALDVTARLHLTRGCRLRMVGTGPMAGRLEQETARLGMTDMVELVGSVEDVRPHIEWADVLLSTSRTEGFPAAVLEAASGGVPAVAFDVGGTREGIIDGVTGRLVPAGDMDGLVEALEGLAGDPTLRRRMGEAGRELVRRDFLLDSATEHYHDLLTRIVEGAPVRVHPRVAHLTTVDMSLRHLVLPQLMGAKELGCEAVGISAPGPFTPQLESLGVRHVPLPSSTRGWNIVADVRAAVQLWGILRRERPDVLHTHNPKPGLYGRIVGRLAGVPVVVNTVHGLYATAEDPWWKRAFVYAGEALASRFSDAELYQSREDLTLVRRLRLVHRTKLHHLGNGIDLERFSPDVLSPERRSEMRASLGVGEGQILVGMVGRLVAEKGYPDLFEAAARVDGQYRFVCIGPRDPDKADRLGDGAIEAAERAGVLFLGMRADIEELYAAMDILVLPSHREGLPRSVMEAAACGVPAVATDIRGCRDAVDDGVNGILVPPRDPDALAAAIRKLGEDPGLRRRMGLEGRRIALRRFDEARVVDTVLRTYAAVADAKGIPWPREHGMDPQIRRAEIGDVPALARLHAGAIDTGFLSTLGGHFLEVLYRGLVSYPDGILLTAEAGGRVVGFVAGVVDTRRFYRWFLRRHGVSAALRALPRLVRPGVARQVWETLRYPGEAAPSGAELLSTAVDESCRGRGIGSLLGDEFLAGMRRQGLSVVRVVVGSANSAAINFYGRLGFRHEGSVEVHSGRPSALMTWSPS